MFDLALKVFLLLSPIFFIPLNGFLAKLQFYQFGYFTNSLLIRQLQFFQYGTLCLFLIALFDKPRRQFQNKTFALLFLICLWSVSIHPETIKNFPNIFLGFLLYYLVVVYTKDVKSVIRAIIVVSALNTIFAILQHCGIFLIYKPRPEIFGQPEIFGLMSHKGHLGVYQALAVPICYAINPLLSFIPLIGLFLSKSLTAIIPMTIGMSFLLIKRIHKLRQIGMPFFGCLIFFTIILYGNIFRSFFYRFGTRTFVWVETLKMIIQKPLAGYGIGTFKFLRQPSADITVEYTDPYSLYLMIIHAVGIFGILALSLFLWNKFINFKNNTHIAEGIFTSCLILLFVGAGLCFLNYPRLAGTAIVLFGLLAIKKEEIC